MEKPTTDDTQTFCLCLITHGYEVLEIKIELCRELIERRLFNGICITYVGYHKRVGFFLIQLIFFSLNKSIKLKHNKMVKQLLSKESITTISRNKVSQMQLVAESVGRL